MRTLDKWLHARHGPMTADMVQHPGDFGLGRVPRRLAPAATADLICGFCSTGCSLRVHLDATGQAINLTANPDYPVNLGMACPKGWEALTPLAAPDRATTPLQRDPVSGELRPVSWERALAMFVENFKDIRAHRGPHAMAVLGTGQMPMEEIALLGALAKFGLGLRHVDSNTRQCMATAHVAYKQSFGFDAPPFCYDDFEESDALVFVGANPCIAHPILWQRVMRNRRRPEIVVIDPRRTETAMAATLHVALKPKSDLTLLVRRLATGPAARDVHDLERAGHAFFLLVRGLDAGAREGGGEAAKVLGRPFLRFVVVALRALDLHAEEGARGGARQVLGPTAVLHEPVRRSVHALGLGLGGTALGGHATLAGRSRSNHGSHSSGAPNRSDRRAQNSGSQAGTGVRAPRNTPIAPPSGTSSDHRVAGSRSRSPGRFSSAASEPKYSVVLSPRSRATLAAEIGSRIHTR